MEVIFEGEKNSKNRVWYGQCEFCGSIIKSCEKDLDKSELDADWERRWVSDCPVCKEGNNPVKSYLDKSKKGKEILARYYSFIK